MRYMVRVARNLCAEWEVSNSNSIEHKTSIDCINTKYYVSCPHALGGWLVCGWAQPGSHAACRPAVARLVRYHSRLIGLRMQEYRSSWDAVWLLACLTQKWFSVSARFPMRSRLHHRSLVPGNGRFARSSRAWPRGIFCMRAAWLRRWTSKPILWSLHLTGLVELHAANQSAPRVSQQLPNKIVLDNPIPLS